jgi:hypothetical protein
LDGVGPRCTHSPSAQAASPAGAAAVRPASRSASRSRAIRPRRVVCHLTRSRTGPRRPPLGSRVRCCGPGPRLGQFPTEGRVIFLR